MKTIKFFAIIALIMGFTSCSKDDNLVIGNDTVDFTGTFSREFEVPTPNKTFTQKATYTISEDKINYKMGGGFAKTDYDIKKEYYSKEENRWIGYRADTKEYYVIFLKDVTKSSITLYKKVVASVEEGKKELVPAENDKENHGWNTYTTYNIVKNFSAQAQGHGPNVSGNFTKFDFTTGKITESAEEWDIAFRATSIIVNGGTVTGTKGEPVRNGKVSAYIIDKSFEEVTSVDEKLLKQDSADGLAIPTGSGKGWYKYDMNTHVISPIPGKTLVFKTRKGIFVKVGIISYYKDNDGKTSRYYTFKYENL
ncbi:MAG: HmuY family protein [Tenacibaculum sp.]|nr:HmuY family protein [Tenacibaculum sp.]